MSDLFDDPTPAGGHRAHRPARRPASATRRTRTHHVVVPDPARPVAVDPDAVDVWGVDGFGHRGRWADVPPSDDPELDAWVETFEETPPRRRGTGVDPLLLRLGAIVGAAVLVTPLAIGLRDDASGAELRSPDVAAAAAAPAAGGRRATTAPATQETLSTALSPVAATQAKRRRQAPAEEAAAPQAASANQAAEAAAAPACSIEYEIVAGDYWLRLADASGTDLDELLAVNGATTDTPLYPGYEICLPDGATIPAPPPTTAAPTTPPPTEPETTRPPTTPAPTEPPTTPAPTDPPTTRPPTTPPPPPPRTRPPSTSDVEAIIRYVWPDELEDRAVVIATRESSLIPTARNYCCYGLFQIYYDVHRSWLADLGVDSAEDLFDPATNARAAYVLYQRSGGWDPWAMTAY